MQLKSAKVGPFRSINEPQTVEIDPQVTVLVGMNEAGKTVFLKALHKTKDALSTEKFNLTDDYPRKNLTVYRRRHEEQPDDAVVLSYRLSDEEVSGLNSKIGCTLEKGFEFTVSHRYDDTRTVGITIPEKPVLQKLAATAGLSPAVITAFGKATSLSNVLDLLKEISELGEVDKAMLATLEARVSAKPENWSNVCQHEAWQILRVKIPQSMGTDLFD